MSEIRILGVIGAGTMGSGIAQASATAGLQSVMVDVSEAALERGLSGIGASLDRLVNRQKIAPADKIAALKGIERTTDYGALKRCDLIIEAATENEDDQAGAS
jgi:3-hydroxybutyryl-CoA dehydrogenase